MPNRNHFYPDLAYLPNTEEVFIFWSEMDGDQNQRGLYGQKMDLTGERLWTDNGNAFLELSGADKQDVTAKSAEDDVIVFYRDFSFGNVLDCRVMAMRIHPDGSYVWENENVALSSLQSPKTDLVVSSFLNEQWIVTWEDERNDGGDIYAQNIRLNGELGPSGMQIEDNEIQISEYLQAELDLVNERDALLQALIDYFISEVALNKAFGLQGYRGRHE